MSSRDAWLQRWAALILVAPVLAFFAPVLFLGRALYLHDTSAYFFPYKVMIGEALHHGRLPEWSPYSFGGAPLLVDPNFNAFHPLSVITDLFPNAWGYGLFVAANAWLAAYGTWVLARRLGVAPEGALIAALCFGWSGTFVSLLESGQFVAPATMPWVMATSLALAETPSVRTAAFAVLAATLMFVSGTPEVGACGFLLGAVMGIANASHRSRAAVWLTGAYAGGVALAAVQLLPAYEFLQHSSRAEGWPLEKAMASSLLPLRLINLAFPFFSGEANAPGVVYWLSDPRAHSPYVSELYVGLFPLGLAGIGALTTRSKALLWLVPTTVVLVVMALGKYTPVYPILWHLLPTLRTVRFPVKFVIPLALTLALLAGNGWAALGRSARWKVPFRFVGVATLVVLIVIVSIDGRLDTWLDAARAACLRATFLASLVRELLIVSVVLGLLAWQERIPRARWIILVLLVVELGLPAMRFDQTIPAAELTHDSEVARALRDDAHGLADDEWRFDEDMNGHPRPQDLAEIGDRSWPRTRRIRWLQREALSGAQPSLDGVYQSRGYSGFTSGPMKEFFGRSPPEEMMRLFGVRYGIAWGDDPLYERLGFTRLASLEHGAIQVWKSASIVPKARLVDAVLSGPGLDELPRCSGREVVWLSPDDASHLPAGLHAASDCASLAPSESASARTRLATYEPELVRVEVESPAAVVLVLADAGDPGWRATIDGAVTRPMLADAAFRAVGVPSGRHVVEWRYETPGLRLGACVSLVALIALALAFWMSRGSRSHSASVP